jgi:hypothetical protein
VTGELAKQLGIKADELKIDLNKASAVALLQTPAATLASASLEDGAKRDRSALWL